ncbi:hypothetical protein RCL1_004493 [Eukaryota sp. TZLM3-RCL]
MTNDYKLAYDALKTEHERLLASISTLKEIISILKQELTDCDKLREEACNCVDSLQQELNELRPLRRQLADLSDNHSGLHDELSRLRQHNKILSLHDTELRISLKQQKEARMFESFRAENALMYSLDLENKLLRTTKMLTERPTREEFRLSTTKISQLESQLLELGSKSSKIISSEPSKLRPSSSPFASPLSLPQCSSYVSLSKENSALKAVVERQSEELSKLRSSILSEVTKKKESVLSVAIQASETTLSEDISRLEQLLIIKDLEILDMSRQLLS